MALLDWILKKTWVTGDPEGPEYQLSAAEINQLVAVINGIGTKIDDILNNVGGLEVVQTEGPSTTAVMSQAIVTLLLGNKASTTSLTDLETAINKTLATISTTLTTHGSTLTTMGNIIEYKEIATLAEMDSLAPSGKFRIYALRVGNATYRDLLICTNFLSYYGQTLITQRAINKDKTLSDAGSIDRVNIYSRVKYQTAANYPAWNDVRSGNPDMTTFANVVNTATISLSSTVVTDGAVRFVLSANKFAFNPTGSSTYYANWEGRDKYQDGAGNIYDGKYQDADGNVYDVYNKSIWLLKSPVQRRQVAFDRIVQTGTLLLSSTTSTDGTVIFLKSANKFAFNPIGTTNYYANWMVGKDDFIGSDGSSLEGRYISSAGAIYEYKDSVMRLIASPV